jgi:peptide deformylase
MADKNSIISLPHPNLRERSRKVKVITEDTKKLIEDMKQATMDWEDSRPHELGVALAAVQIDQLERVVIVRSNFDNKEDKTFIILINPEIIKAEGEKVKEHEGCLSVKDVYGLVPRYSKVRIKAMNLNGEQIRLKAEGFLARVLQHEIDHTNGNLFIDHVESRDEFFSLDKDGKMVPMPKAEVKSLNLFKNNG